MSVYFRLSLLYCRGNLKGSVSGSSTGHRDPGSRRPVLDPETLGLGVRYRTPSQPSEEWALGSGIKINKSTVYKLFWQLMTIVGNLNVY